MERTIKLLTDMWRYYPDCISWGNPYKKYEVEPTGRWKVVVKNKVSTLYLECFKWIDKEVRTPKYSESITYSGWFGRGSIIGSKRDYLGDIITTKLSVKNLGWIPENSLTVEVVEKEEFINTCGDCS